MTKADRTWRRRRQRRQQRMYTRKLTLTEQNGGIERTFHVYSSIRVYRRTVIDDKQMTVCVYWIQSIRTIRHSVLIRWIAMRRRIVRCMMVINRSQQVPTINYTLYESAIVIHLYLIYFVDYLVPNILIIIIDIQILA